MSNDYLRRNQPRRDPSAYLKRPAYFDKPDTPTPRSEDSAQQKKGRGGAHSPKDGLHKRTKSQRKAACLAKLRFGASALSGRTTDGADQRAAFGYGSHRKSESNVAVGLFEQRGGGGPDVDAMTLRTKSGRNGFSLSAQLLTLKGNGSRVQPELSVYNAKSTLRLDEGNFEASVGYALVEGAGTLKRVSPDSDKDYNVRAAVGIGWAAGIRTHRTDDDGDGIPEIGLGVDTPFGSVDYKTEDARGAVEIGSWIPGSASIAADLLGPMINQMWPRKKT